MEIIVGILAVVGAIVVFAKIIEVKDKARHNRIDRTAKKEIDKVIERNVEALSQKLKSEGVPDDEASARAIAYGLVHKEALKVRGAEAYIHEVDEEFLKQMAAKVKWMLGHEAHEDDLCFYVKDDISD